MARRPSVSPRAAVGPITQRTAVQYQLRIELRHVEPRVWRRVLLEGKVTLEKLHVILVSSMGWHGGHLHEFEISGQRYGIPHGGWPTTDAIIDERRVRLKPLIESGVRLFTYVYDFGDHWEHSVEVEDVAVARLGAPSAQCLAGANACPPDDVGGPHGYFEFLAVLNNPAHQHHAEVSRWIGGSFDPTAFDIVGINERLATIKP